VWGGVGGATVAAIQGRRWLGSLLWRGEGQVQGSSGMGRWGRLGRMGWLTGGELGWLGMTLAMLGPGQAGMFLGWAFDVGWGPVLQDGVCLCCSARHLWSLDGGIPWMHVGMLAVGVPLMIPFAGTGRGRGWVVGMGGVGMMLGMAVGADAFLAWAGPGHPWQFGWAALGMCLGMHLGMLLGCAVGEAIRHASRKGP
jgi:hypothetical protein